jgi:lipopolysaccharide assembly outer membrane protein LptD (OstA)
VLVLASGAAARAQGLPGFDPDLRDEALSQPVEISADVLEYEAPRALYVASGDVRIRQGERVLSADWIAFSPDTGVGVASGRVKLIESGETLEADFVEFEIDTLEGVLRNARLDSPASQFRTAGGTIEKTGERSYRLEDAVFTTCLCEDESCPEPWRIRAREAELEIDGYGTVRDARFEVLGVPLVWLPWMLYPIKTQRETGFLFPEISLASRDGFGLGLPFFWAVRDELNVTVTPAWTSERGFAVDSDVEYVLGEQSWGDLYGAFLNDEDIDPNSLEEPYDRERWAATGRQDFFLPGGLRAKTDFRFASDNDVPLDVDGLKDRRADRFLESTVFLSGGAGRSGRFGGAVSALYADDMQSPEDVDRDDTLLQRMPEVELSALPGSLPGLPWLQPSLDVDYTLFAARDRARGGPNGFLDTGVDGIFNFLEQRRGPQPPAFDPHLDDFATAGGSEGDGRFQEGEPLTDEGQRLLLAPRVAAPFRLGEWLEVYPEAGWQQTFSSTHLDDHASRGRFTGRLDLRSRLRRRFGSGWLPLVEPRLGYAYLGTTSQSDNPLLVPGTAVPQRRIRSLDLDAVTRDGADRVPGASRLAFGVAQRLYGEGGAGGLGALQADLTLLGSYDFEQHDWGPIVADGRVSPWGVGQVRFSAGFDPERTDIDEAHAEWRWRHRRGHGFRLGYRYLRDVPLVFEDFGTGDRFDDVERSDRVHEATGGFDLRLTRHWRFEYRAAYSFDESLLLANQGLVEYLSRCGCWAAGLELSQDRARGVDVKVLYRLIGLGRDRPLQEPGLLD